MRLRVLPEFGTVRISDLHRTDVQDLIDDLLGQGFEGGTIQGTVRPLAVILRRSVKRGDLVMNPCDGLDLPASEGRRDRIADPLEADELIKAIGEQERALWASAMYAGLRRGELMALRWENVDLANGVIRVEHGWDQQEGEIELKSDAGRRKVPVAAALRDHLLEHRLTTGRDQGLVFGRTADRPFVPRNVIDHADDAWKDAKLDRITLHECRHTFASLMIAAGVNAKALSTYMGHANISITLDRYGHLMPGNEEEAAGLLDVYLKSQGERQAERARAAEPTQAVAT
jgi:integrase